MYYRELPKCLVGGRFGARDTARVRTDATQIEPLQHHSSQSCANLMSIQCQSNANLVSIHHLSDFNPSPIRCRSSANPSQYGAKPLTCQSPQPGRRQFIGNPVPIQHKSISNPLSIDSPFIPNPMSIHDQSLNRFASFTSPAFNPAINFQYSTNLEIRYQFNSNSHQSIFGLPIHRQSATNS